MEEGEITWKRSFWQSEYKHVIMHHEYCLQVYEGLMDSAKLIAVKEVELDVETNEKAKVVSHCCDFT